LERCGIGWIPVEKRIPSRLKDLGGVALEYRAKRPTLTKNRFGTGLNVKIGGKTVQLDTFDYMLIHCWLGPGDTVETRGNKVAVFECYDDD
jgi:hypothetical protein